MSGLATSFNIKFLGFYVEEGYTVYVINPDVVSESMFKKKTGGESKGKKEAPLSRLSSQPLTKESLGLSLNAKPGTMHYLKIKTGQEEALRSAMQELLELKRSGRRPVSHWDDFFDRLKEVKQLDFETLKDLWTSGKEAQKAAAEAAHSEARRKLALINRAKAAEALTVEKVLNKKGVGEKRGRAEEVQPDLSNTRRREEAPGSVLGRLPGEDHKFDFLLGFFPEPLEPLEPLERAVSTTFFKCFSVLGKEDLPGGRASVEITSAQLGPDGEPDSFLSLLAGVGRLDGSDGRSSTWFPV